MQPTIDLSALPADRHATIEQVHRHIAEVEDVVHKLIMKHPERTDLAEVCNEFNRSAAEVRHHLCDLRLSASLTATELATGVESARAAIDRALAHATARLGTGPQA